MRNWVFARDLKINDKFTIQTDMLIEIVVKKITVENDLVTINDYWHFLFDEQVEIT